jgi:amino acid adenylation domain-containing protein
MALTQFPCLFTDEFDLETAKTTETTFDLIHSSKKAIYKAWGSLLMAYADHEEVTFLADGIYIKVTSLAFDIEELPSFPGTSFQGCTAVLFDSPDPVSIIALSLKCDFTSGSCVLRSSGYVPTEFLHHLQVHLCEAVAWFKDNDGSSPLLSSLSDLPCSVSNASPQQLPGPVLLHELVKQAGEQVALEYREADGSGLSLSFNQLNERSLQVSRAIYAMLGSRASHQQPIIAILLPQSAELYIGQLGILKSGCAFCCINIDTPEERLNFILEDIGAEVMLTRSALLKTTSKVKIQCLLVDQMQLHDETTVSDAMVFDAKAKDIAYVMYTSGSTGLPKGVPVSHGAVTQSLLAHNEHIPNFSRFLQFAAPTFDVSIFEIYFPLFRGKTLVSCDRTTMLNDLVGIMNELAVDAAELTPTVASSLLQRREVVPKLKLLLTIGEMLNKRVIQAFGGSEQKESMLWAMYGPTEAAVHCTLQPAMKTTSRTGNIGYPLSSVSAFVVALADNNDLSGELQVLPIGFVGELAIGGLQLAEGYLHRPEQTTSVFIESKLWGRVYRTGDKARMLPDGYIECLGRISSGQVKLRGQRVELGEIEQTALRVTACRNSVAVVTQVGLVMFCEVDRGVLSEHIMDECLKWLPSHMVPAEVLLSNQFPYLSSGKVDKARLQADYERSLDISHTELVDLKDETSKVIYALLQEMLGHSFPANMNLTSAGVDSLVAIKLASRLRQSNINVTALDVLKSENLWDVREVIRQNSETSRHVPSKEQEPGVRCGPDDLSVAARKHPFIDSQWTNVEGIYKCTSSQVGMLVETSIDPYAYCNWIKIEAPSDVSESQIRAWLLKLIERYQPLRSSLIQTDLKDHRFVQVIWKRIPESVIETVVEIQKNDFYIDDTSIIAHPVKFQLIVNPGNRIIIMIRLHHAIYDGWSIDLLMRDFEILLTGKILPVSEPFHNVQEYHETLDTGDALAYWQDHLLGCTPTLLPSHESETSQNIETVALFEAPCTPHNLHISASKLRIGVQCFFQAALFHLIGQITDNRDIMIATVTSGRTIPIDGIEHIFGPCMRALPMRINLSHSRYISDLLRNIHRLNRSLAEYASVSVQDIKGLCSVDPGVPLSDILFIWQESSESRSNGQNSFKIVNSSNNVENKFVIEIEPHGERFVARATAKGWNPPIALADTLSRLGEIISLMVANSHAELSLLPVLFDRKSIHRSSPPELKSSVKEFPEGEHDWNSNEVLIRNLMSDITDFPERNIKKHASIFRFGVDSIQAIVLARRLRENGFSTASVSMVLKHSTIYSLAQALNNQINEQKNTRSEPLTFLSDQELEHIKSSLIEEGLQLEDILPCTPLQVAMLSSTYTNHSDLDSYSNVMVFRVLSDPLSLRQSLEAVIPRHEIFRTIFIQTENAHFPFVQGHLKQYQDLWDNTVEQSEPFNQDEAALMIRATRCISQLREQIRPLVSLRSFSHGESCYLELICHHAVYDASAIQILIQEVESRCQNDKLERPVSSKPFLRLMQSTQNNDAERFWMDSLQDFKPTLLKYATPYRSSVSTSALSISLRSLEAACRNLSVTLANVLQAGLAKLLSQLFDSKDVCFGNVISGRTHSIDSLERLVFPTFNTLPLRTKLSKLPDNRSLLIYLRDFMTNSDHHNLIPLRTILQRHEASADGLFSALILIQQGAYQVNRDIWELVMDLGNIDVSFYDQAPYGDNSN